MIKRYFSEAHIEACKGTVSDNILYIKKDGKWLDDLKMSKRLIIPLKNLAIHLQILKGKEVIYLNYIE